MKPSADGRCLIDQEDRPFFHHADTAWTMAKRLRPEEVAECLDDRKARGFTAIHMRAFSKEQGRCPTARGRSPSPPADDILKPNEAARSRGMVVSLSAIWIRWGGRDRC